KVQNEPEWQGKQFVLKHRLAQHPEISMVALGDLPMSDWMTASLMYSGMDSTAIQKQMMFKNIDPDYLALYRIPLLAGRNIQQTDSVRELVINETALHAFGFDKPIDAVGQQLFQGSKSRLIVGVVKDFHQFNLK